MRRQGGRRARGAPYRPSRPRRFRPDRRFGSRRRSTGWTACPPPPKHAEGRGAEAIRPSRVEKGDDLLSSPPDVVPDDARAVPGASAVGPGEVVEVAAGGAGVDRRDEGPGPGRSRGCRARRPRAPGMGRRGRERPGPVAGRGDLAGHRGGEARPREMNALALYPGLFFSIQICTRLFPLGGRSADPVSFRPGVSGGGYPTQVRERILFGPERDDAGPADTATRGSARRRGPNGCRRR